MASMSDAAAFSLTKSSDYSEFLEIDKLHITKSSATTRDGSNKVFTDYIKTSKTDTPPSSFYVQNAMPNAGDIHPSTFGHELIGNAVFSHIFPALKVSGKAEDLYTLSTAYNTGDEATATSAIAAGTYVPNFERFDEKPDLSHATANMIENLFRGSGAVPVIFKNMGDTIKLLLKTNAGMALLGKLLPVLADPAGHMLQAASLIGSLDGYLNAVITELGKKATQAVKAKIKSDFQKAADAAAAVIGGKPFA